MNITKTDPVTCASLIVAKKKAIDDEMLLRRSFTETTMPPKSEDLAAVSGLADLSEVFVLSGFAGRDDMDIIAYRFFETYARNRMVNTIIVQSPDENHRLDAELDTIQKIRGLSDSFRTIMLDISDPDQTPLLIFGPVADEDLQYRSSPDYAVDIVNAAQEKKRWKAAAEAEAQRAARPMETPPVFRGLWQVA